MFFKKKGKFDILLAKLSIWKQKSKKYPNLISIKSILLSRSLLRCAFFQAQAQGSNGGCH